MLKRDSCRQPSETLSEKRESRTPRVYLPSQSQILQLGNKEELGDRDRCGSSVDCLSAAPYNLESDGVS
jgi:hypothetical protein